MSEKKAAMYILGESHIPADLLTPTLGSNYGLDGYPDMEYGMGSLEGILDPEFTESPALPTGLSRYARDEDDGMDLTSLMGESLANLDWLDPTQMQDPDRLPHTPESIPELEEAWGVHRRTNGVQVFARDLDAARYEEGGGTKKKAHPRLLQKVVQRAMRRSAAGDNRDALLKEAVLHLGGQMKRVASALLLVKDEHGLAGNVFIRAAAYPGYGQGKWREHHQKTAKGARYVIVSPKELKTATWIQDGRCVYTKKIAVTEVPWGAAFKHYGRRLASLKTSADRKWFVTKRGGSPYGGPAWKGDKARWFTTEKEATATAKKLTERNPVGFEAEQIPEGFKAGTYPRMVKDSRDARSLLKAAFLRTPEAKQADSHYRPKHDPSLRKGFLAEAGQKQKVYNKQASRVSKGVKSITAAIKQGAYGDQLKSLILKTFRDADLKAAVHQLKPVLQKTGALEQKADRPREYQTPGFTAHSLAQAPSFGDGRVKLASGALKWVQRTMCEGFAGNDLDSIIQHRFASSVLSKLGETLKELRSAHEGGSGFLYVNASAYASPTGVKGCEEGALKHRANQIPAVASMDRCGSCTLARAFEDGTRKCSLYNKPLLDDTSGQEMAGLRAANIQVARMSDAEQTAAFFITPENAYDPSEYGLRNANLDDLELGLPESEKIAAIFFSPRKLGQ